MGWLASAMCPFAGGVYVNVPIGDEADRTGDAYPPATYARLAKIKRHCDPTSHLPGEGTLAAGQSAG